MAPEERKVTWRPDPGRAFCPSEGSLCHGPGGVFVPDGSGGGSLTFEEEVKVTRRGFRPRVQVVKRTIRKEAGHG